VTTTPGKKNGNGNGSGSLAMGALLREFERSLPQMNSEDAKRQAASLLARLKSKSLAPSDPSILNELVRLCVQGGLRPLLGAYGISYPTYNYFEHFIDEDEPARSNALGPWAAPRVNRLATPPVWRVLGFDVGFPLGIPASVLTATSAWIDYYARLGFNVLTFKTVRSRQWDAHAKPNWVFLRDLEKPLAPDSLPESAIGDESYWPSDPHAFSMANSFGVPSFDPSFWQPDLEKARECLGPGQLLIVSVMGTTEKYSGKDLVADFVKVALMAEDAGALAIELNLSCPNTLEASGKVKTEMICDSPESTKQITEAVRDRLSPATKLVIKMRYQPPDVLQKVVLTVGRLVDGISGINTVQMSIVNEKGSPTFPNRSKAGVSGIAIQKLGISFVNTLRAIRDREKFDFDIIGMGGVMNPSDIEAYQRAGATAVQTATAAFFNPRLPLDVQEYREANSVDDIGLRARARALELLSEGPKSFGELVESLGDLLAPTDLEKADRAQKVLEGLVRDSQVVSERHGNRLLFQLSNLETPVENSR